MEYRRFNNHIVLRLNVGEELISSVLKLAEKENIKLASVSGIGATNDATLGVFEIGTKTYHKKRFCSCDYEIASLMGNLSVMDTKPYLHLHAVVGSPETGECHGGHLSEAMISATAEIVISVIDGIVDRTYSDDVGLNLFDFNK